MKSWISRTKPLAIMLAVASLLSSCQPPVVEKVGEATKEKAVDPFKVVKQEAVNQKVAAKMTLPLDRMVTNSSGKQIAVTIIGKSFDKIEFTRKSDGKKYVLPISSLSIADQQFLTTVESTEDNNFEKDEPSGGLTPVMEVKLRSVEKRLSRVIEDIADLEAKMKSTNLAEVSPRRRGMIREISVLEQEKAELEGVIAGLERRK